MAVVIARSALPRVPSLLHQLSTSCGVRLVQCVNRDLESWCCTLASWQGNESPSFLTVEVFADYVREGKQIFPAEWLLAERTLLKGNGEVASCYVTMRYTIIDLIFSEPVDSARTLAEEADFAKRKSD